MSCMTVDFFSRVLSLSCSMEIVLCDSAGSARGAAGRKEPYPVLYLLHGGDGDHTSWRRNVAVERIACDSGLAIVMPATQHGFYTDQKGGYDYFRFLADELPLLLRDSLNVSTERQDSYAAGLSMGGYGAFKLGILRPDRFAAVASLSGSLDQRRRLTADSDLKNAVMQRMAYLAFGSYDEYVGSENDLFASLERKLVEGTALPEFFMACGEGDHNIRVNDDFFDRFRDRVSLVYERTEGAGHAWEYWEDGFARVIRWLAAIRGRGAVRARGEVRARGVGSSS